MYRDYDQIKEISMVSSCISGSDFDYEDLLRISKLCISYRRKRIGDGKEIIHWSYKTTSDVLNIKYKRVCDCLYDEFRRVHQKGENNSPYRFNIRITYIDGSYENLGKNGTFSDNGMMKCALEFIKIIPEFEQYPEVLTIFKGVYLSKKVLSQIDKTKISGLMFAEGGAMGRPGCVELITDEFVKYYTDGIGGRPTDVSLLDVSYIMDVFESGNVCGKNRINFIELNGESWVYCWLGAGNHLYLRHDFYRILGELFVNYNPAIMYRKWYVLSSSATKDNSCVTIEIEGDALINECDVLCHQVNLSGVMGGGIALSIARKFPHVEREYQNYSSKKLGEVCFAKTDNYIIANCFSQNKNYDTDYDSLRVCLDKVVFYMKENHLHSVAIPYKYGCGIANGDWDIVRSIFEEKLKGFTLVIYRLNSSNNEKAYCKHAVKNENPVLMIYEALAVLHNRGYEKLRIMSSYSPSGIYFRCVISVAENFDKTTGFVCNEDKSYPIFRYSTGAEFEILTDDISYENKTIYELADAILAKYPEFGLQGKGEDKAYVAWFKNVLDLCRDNKYPYAFEDGGYDIFNEGKICLTNGEWVEYAPVRR